MATQLLEDLIVKKLKFEEFKKWFLKTHFSDDQSSGIDSYGCTQGDFAVFFLNHLRDQTESFRTVMTQSTPIKIKTPRQNKILSINSTEDVNKKVRRVELFPSKSLGDFKTKSVSPKLRSPNKSKKSLDADIKFNESSSEILQSSTPDHKNNSKYSMNSSRSSIHDSKRNIFSDSFLHTLSPVRDYSSGSKSGTNSPKYNPSIKNTPKDHKRSVDNRKHRFSDTPRSNELCLGDFIVTSPRNETFDSDKSCSEKKKIKTRRIKPTLIVKNIEKSNVILKNVESNNEQSILTNKVRSVEMNPIFKNENDKNITNLTEERNVLKEECMRIKTSQVNDQSLNIFTPKKFKEFFSDHDFIKPNFNSVTNKDILDVYVDIYCFMLNNNLVLNVMNELCFIIMLLLTQQKVTDYKNVEVNEIKGNDVDKTDIKEEIKNDSSVTTVLDKKSDESMTDLLLSTNSELNKSEEVKNYPTNNLGAFLKTIHNCVYFSVRVLQNQLEILTLCDRYTIKILLQNPRVKEMSLTLHNKLNDYYEQKLNNDINDLQPVQVKTNVCFDSDTDNRANFPSDFSFSTFRKQRDLFYEILRIWETKHLNAGWNFTFVLGPKIKTLVTISSDSFNFMHLARLFKAQLLSSCSYGTNNIDDENLALSLKNVSSTKLSLLHSRLTTSQSGNTASTDFPGHQEFFKMFILNANYIFLKHLVDIFVHTIHEYKHTDFNIRESGENDIDEKTKMEIVTTISSLKLLSKFVGFIECLPYHTITENVSDLMYLQMNIRNEAIPYLDVLTFLKSSFTEHSLTITIPWIVEYLAMLDYATIRLPRYSEILFILFEIYIDCVDSYSKHESRYYIHKNVFEMPTSSKLFLKFTLGWFFQRKYFPEELYFTWLTNYKNTAIRKKLSEEKLADEQLNDKKNDKEDVIENAQAKMFDKFNKIMLDKVPMINGKMFYLLCPYFSELKSLLLTNTTSIKNSCLTRHITPVSTIKTDVTNNNAKQLELQMEEMFFNSHPTSMRKTVDFVAERVASCCIKHICNNLMTTLKESARKDLTSTNIQLKKNSDIKNDKEKLKLELEKNIQTIAERFHSQLVSCLYDLCFKRCEDGINALIGPDIQKPVIDLCVKFTIRSTRWKVLQWIQSHASINVFYKDLQSHLKTLLSNEYCSFEEKELLSIIDKMENKITTNNCDVNPIETIYKLRDLIVDALEGNSHEISDDEIKHMLSQISNSISVPDLLNAMHKVIVQLSLDFAVVLVSHKPVLFKNVISSFISIWFTYPENDTIKKERELRQKISNVNEDTFDYMVEDESVRLDQDLNITDLKLDSKNPFSRVICSRNIYIIAQSQTPVKSWETLGFMLSQMLKEDLVNIDELSEQCTSVFREEWPLDILRDVSKCFSVVIDEYKKMGRTDCDKFILLLEFLSETCNNLERVDYF